MALPTRARIAGMLAISLLMLSAPGALALIPNYLPDAQIRPGWNPSYTGGGVINTDAFGQSVFNTGVVAQKLTFFIKIVNVGATSDNFKVKRSSGFTNGYRVRYYDAANNDVTGQVTTGTFTTPMLLHFGEYVMRATVKIKSWATACSNTSRLITVSSVGLPAARDAVRFTASLSPNCDPVAVDDTNDITEDAVPDSVTGNVLANDTDPDGDILFVLPTIPCFTCHYSLLSINADGTYLYQLDNTDPAVMALNNGGILVDEIPILIGDDPGGTDTSKLTITIHGHTDP